jgi:hypothetical protein
MRSVVWWLIVLIFGTSLATYNYPAILPSNSQFLGLLLPSIFTQSCQYKSLHFMLLMTPICQYMGRFSKFNLSGMTVLVCLAIFSTYSDLLGVIIASAWTVSWLVVSIYHKGYFIAISRRWLSLSEI